MNIVRYCAMLLYLAAAAPVAAQGVAPAQGQPRADDIIVNARIEPKSPWKRAETPHVMLYGTGSDAQLKRIARNLEQLHLLLTRLYRRGDTSDDVLPVQVTLIDSASHFRAMHLTAERAQEGPFAPGFAAATFFESRDDGDVLAVAQADQTITLDTSRRFAADCDDYLEGDPGSLLCGPALVSPGPMVRRWETLLYSAFARRFLLAYTPAAYPRWYLDGLGALFSTIDVKANGAVDYARPPVGYKAVMRSYGYPQVAEILTGRYLATPGRESSWSPYGAWLLTHYFVFSQLKPERSRQFAAYMAAIRQGTPMADAAAVFGDMGRLQHDVQKYAASQIAFAHDDPPATPIAEPQIGALSLASGALVEARVELGARALPELAEEARDLAARYPDSPEALAFAVEVTCRGGDAAACIGAADRVLARAPQNVAALAWKGSALTDQALAAPATDRSALLAAARRVLERAVALGGQSALPAMAYFESFTKAGERVPDAALRGLTTVIRAAPAAPGPRLLLAQELIRQGQADLARRVLTPVLYGAFDSPEKTQAQRLFAASATPPAGG